MLILYIFIILSVLAICFYLPEVFLILHFRQKCKAGTRIRKAANYFQKVSVVLPVYNEEKLIERKMENLLELKYPRDLIEIIVVDGNSSDRTVELVKKFVKAGVQLVESKEREGVTEAVKTGVSLSTGEIVVMTDAEALFEPNAIRLIVEDFEDPEVGAVSGHQVLSNLTNNVFTMMETTYRNFHEKMRLAESAMHSTSHFKGELVGVRRDLFPFNMDPNKGALDRGIAFNAIRKGYKAVCDERILFYDIATSSLKDRNRQKTQRGTLLQETMLQNLDMLFNPRFKAFGLLVFPSNFFIYFLFPPVFLALTLMFPIVLLYLASHSLFVASALIVMLVLAMASSKKVFLFLLTFLHSQIILVVGLIRIAIIGKQKFLKQVEGTRKHDERIQ